MRNSLNYTAALAWPVPLPATPRFAAQRSAMPSLTADRTKREVARALVTRRSAKSCAGDDLPKRRHRISLTRELIAACVLLAVVGLAVFGPDLLWRDSVEACQQRVVAPENYATDPDTRGERIDRLDWDRDLNAGGTPASRHVPRDVNDCAAP